MDSEVGRRMLVVALTFCIIPTSLALPVYQYSPSPVPSYYTPVVSDPYVVPYPQIDPYIIPYPTVDPYLVPYPTVDPYGLPSPQPYLSQPVPSPYIPTVDAYYQVPPSSPYPPVGDPYFQQPPPYPSPVDPYAVSPTPNYALAPSKPQYLAPSPSPSYPSQVVVEQDTYDAITYHELAERKHCGILAATNDDLYTSLPSMTASGVNDVAPFGAYPWVQLLVDNTDNNVVCQATKIQSMLALVPSSCLNGPASKYSVVSDWDLLTIYNEYEAYKSLSNPVCTMWPLGIDNSSEVTEYTMGGSNSELTLIVLNEDETHDKYPAQKLLCLPSKSSTVPSGGYQPPPPAPAPSPYSYPSQPYPFQLPYPLYSPYPQITASVGPKADCWVVGYRYAPTTSLQNHPQPVPVDNAPSPFSSFQQFYSSQDNSNVLRKASVRQIQCPPGYPNAGSDDACFVGVNGYDACVADKGAAVFCVITDDTKYESGFSDDSTSDHGVIPPGQSQQSSPPPQIQTKPIQAKPAQAVGDRMRAVLYGVVRVPTTCTSSLTTQQQSNYIVTSRVSPSIRGAIVDFQWAAAQDSTCSAEKIGEPVPPLSSSPPSSPPYPPPPQPPSPYQTAAVAPPSYSVQPQLYDPSILLIDPYQQPPPPPPPPQPYQPQVYPDPLSSSSYQPPLYPDPLSSSPYPPYTPSSQVVVPYSYPLPADPVVSYSPAYSFYPQQFLPQYPPDLYGFA